MPTASACCRSRRWRLQHEAPLERVSSGVARLDEMLSGKGYYRGSTILVSGTAGTGKTSLAAHFLDAACRRGERCLCFLFEESPQQLASEHALHRHRPRAVGGRGPAAVPCGPAVALRARDASRHDAPGRGGLQADGDRHRPGDQSDDGRHVRRRPGDAHAHDRSPEDREHHRDVDESDAGTDRHRADRDDDFVADGHVDRAGERRGRRARTAAGCTCSSPAAWRTRTSFASSR